MSCLSKWLIIIALIAALVANLFLEEIYSQNFIIINVKVDLGYSYY